MATLHSFVDGSRTKKRCHQKEGGTKKGPNTAKILSMIDFLVKKKPMASQL